MYIESINVKGKKTLLDLHRALSAARNPEPFHKHKLEKQGEFSAPAGEKKKTKPIARIKAKK